MSTIIGHKYSLATSTIFLIIGADQATKYLASKYASSFVCNEGIAFGLPFANTLLLILILMFLSILASREKNSWAIIALALILGGGISNLVDRSTFGCVRDFIAIGIFPSFNLADALISLGVIVQLASFLQKKEK